MIRSQSNKALTSIDGIPFVAYLWHEQHVVASETLDLMFADAGFDDLPPGPYTVVIRHERVEPSAAKMNVALSHPDEIVLLTFVYLEAERVLLRILTSHEKRL